MKEQLITQLSEYHVSRFKSLLDKNQSENALSIMQEYCVDGIEDDNYQWLFANNLISYKDKLRGVSNNENQEKATQRKHQILY